jgi:XTP/dITP diphosphohydrolase
VPDVVLATRNTHKLAEVSRLLAPFGLTVVPIPPNVELPAEVGETFAANALPKAQAAARQLAQPVIADDSGLEAAALGGAPGVRSARFAGENATDAENLQKLLAQVPAGTELRYVCGLAFVDGTMERVFEGECRGRMAPAPRGERGFGYDPVFLPVLSPDGALAGGSCDRTMAELEDSEKDLISHRGMAVRDFARWFLEDRPGLRALTGQLDV